MADWLSREQRSRNMASIRSKGNATTEGVLLRLFRETGISGWRRHADLPGKPDFVFRAQRVAVFVDGCFWHGCPRCYRLPGDNRRYWKAKVVANRNRDRRRTQELRSLGWRVIRIWEHSLKSSPGCRRIVAKLAQALRSRASEGLLAPRQELCLTQERGQVQQRVPAARRQEPYAGRE